MISKELLSDLEKLTLIENQTEIPEQLNNLLPNFLEDINCPFENHSSSWKHFCHLSSTLYQILEVSNVDDESIDHEEINLITNAIKKCCEIGLESVIKRQNDQVTYETTNQSDMEYLSLVSCLKIIDKFMRLQIVNTNPQFDDSKLDFFVGILSVISMKINEKDVSEFKQLYSTLNEIMPREIQFKFLMMSKGFKGLSKEFQLVVHQELMKMIRSKNGIYILCKNLLVKADDKVPIWQRYPMITKIVESSITKSNQNVLIEEIFRTLDITHQSNDFDSVGACVHLIKSLEAKESLKKLIHDQIFNDFNELSQPDVLLTGSILKDHSELSRNITRLHILFSNSSISSLPSNILNDLIFLLFDLFVILPCEDSSKDKLRNILIYYLINRDNRDLKNVIRNLRLKDDELKLRLHPRICYKNNSLQIGPSQEGLRDDSEDFLDLIKNCNNNFLIFDVFHSLILIFGDVQHSNENFLSEYDVDEEILPEVLHKKFFRKLAILQPIQEMIQWKSLQNQLSEKSVEILDAIKEILLKSIEKISSFDEQIFIIFLAIFKELLGSIVNEDQKKKTLNDIELIKFKCRNQRLKEQIDLMFNDQKAHNIDPSNFNYEDAMELIKSKEIYMKVYGIDNLVKLLKKRDEKTLMNRHSILATALQHLKEKESYAFLNIIRLLVALSYHMESEVVDTLVAEYKNEESEIDERLKFGEILMKVVENLGVMAMKFKKQLIQCFLIGSRNANDEFRTSSLANLGNVCRILSYQIHNIFYEMFQHIEFIVRTDVYLPSKRAATMILSQILSNLPNLMDFQDYLLPVYHLLKFIMSNENDPQTRIHAEIALDHLNSKTKDFLNPQLKAEKEIKIRLDENPHKIDDIKFK